MPAQRGKGHVPPDRSKLYAVVEKPTSGKMAGKVTQTFAIDLSWDAAQKKKHQLAATRKTKFATVIEMPPVPPDATMPELEEGELDDKVAGELVNVLVDSDVDFDELEQKTLGTSSLGSGKLPAVAFTADAPAAVGHKPKGVAGCEADCPACEADRKVIDSGLVCASDAIVDAALADQPLAIKSSFNVNDGQVTPIASAQIDKP